MLFERRCCGRASLGIRIVFHMHAGHVCPRPYNSAQIITPTCQCTSGFHKSKVEMCHCPINLAYSKQANDKLCDIVSHPFLSVVRTSGSLIEHCPCYIGPLTTNHSPFSILTCSRFDSFLLFLLHFPRRPNPSDFFLPDNLRVLHCSLQSQNLNLIS